MSDEPRLELFFLSLLLFADILLSDVSTSEQTADIFLWSESVCLGGVTLKSWSWFPTGDNKETASVLPYPVSLHKKPFPDFKTNHTFI